MARNSRTIASSAGGHHVALRCAALLVSAVPLFAQQPATRASRPIELLAAANEESLWLARVEGVQSTLFQRTALIDLRRRQSLNGRVALLATIDRDALVMLDDGSLFRYRPDDQPPSRELDLPGRARPLQLLGVGNTIYALVSAAATRGLEQFDPAASAPASRPFEPGAAALCVARYDGRRWMAVAPCPPVVTRGESGPLEPRLCLTRGEMLLFWTAGDGGQIFVAHLDPQAQTWRSDVALHVPGLRAFWPLTVSGVTTIVVAVDDGAAAGISAFRWLGASGSADWRLSELQFDSLPPTVVSAGAEAAFGFNQHVGLLLRDVAGDGWLQFGYFGAPPAERAVKLDDALAQRRDALPYEGPLQLLALLAVLGVFTVLVLFRRGSLVRPIPLPAGFALAYTTQRLIAWLIDLLPFTLAAAVILRIGWFDAFQQAFSWALNVQPGPDRPAADRMAAALWWAVSAGGYTAYCLLMELTAGRTAGKALLGVHILSETGQRPRLAQLLIRNLSRLLELLPPLWVLGFLALLTRNRQRVGDVFARTVAVRRLAPEDEKPDRERPAKRSDDDDQRSA